MLDTNDMNKYFSVDIELSGKIIGKHSMLALGACVVGDTTQIFYRELKPISPAYEWNAIRKATMGLQCIPPNLRHKEGYDPSLRRFRPEHILRILYKHGCPPERALKELSEWVARESKEYPSIIVAKPLSVEKPVLEWYFKKFSYPYPFNGEEDLIESYQNLVKRKNAHLRELAIPDARTLEHNGLEDCLLQADQFEAILQLRAQAQLTVILESKI